MFNLETQTLNFKGQEIPIERWEVWFQSPFGLCTTLAEAVEKCKTIDVDPNALICPVPVAIAGDNYEIIMRR